MSLLDLLRLLKKNTIQPAEVNTSLSNKNNQN